MLIRIAGALVIGPASLVARLAEGILVTALAVACCLFGSMFPMPRVIYSMANDGIIFRFLSRINRRFETPVVATLVSGLLAGTMALMFALEDLVDMMSIGTLMAYTIVGICVMLLRYTEPSNCSANTDYILLKYSVDSEEVSQDHKLTKLDDIQYKSGILVNENKGVFTLKEYLSQIFNKNKLSQPTDLTSSLVNYATLSFFFVCFLLSLFLTLFGEDLANGDAGVIVLIIIFVSLNILNLFIISVQPESKRHLTFKVPLVPWIPGLSAFFNLYLMCNLSTATWIRFIVWMTLGFLMYFLYGIRHSIGSDVPVIKSDKGFSIPVILIHPPTPQRSIMGTPNTTVKPIIDERKESIIDSPLFNTETFFKERTSSFTSSEGEVVCVEASTQKQSDNIGYSIKDGKVGTSLDLDSYKSSLNAVDSPVMAPLVYDAKTGSCNELNPSVVSLVDCKDSKEKSNESSSLETNTDSTKKVSSKPPNLFIHITDSNANSSRLAEEGVSSSEPVTPSKNIHPFKFLKKSYSFDEVPPSSIDSAMARRVKKFTIIPINDRSPSDLMKEFNDKSASDLMKELSDRLNTLKDSDIVDKVSLGNELDTIKERSESNVSTIGDELSKPGTGK